MCFVRLVEAQMTAGHRHGMQDTSCYLWHDMIRSSCSISHQFSALHTPITITLAVAECLALEKHMTFGFVSYVSIAFCDGDHSEWYSKACEVCGDLSSDNLLHAERQVSVDTGTDAVDQPLHAGVLLGQ